MMRKILIIGVVIVVCIIAGYFLLEHLVEFKPLTEKEIEKIVQERIFEQWPKENEHGLITETLDFLLIKKHKIYKIGRAHV